MVWEKDTKASPVLSVLRDDIFFLQELDLIPAQYC